METSRQVGKAERKGEVCSALLRSVCERCVSRAWVCGSPS